MFPTLLEIAGFRLAAYGVLVAAAYLIGILWLASERERWGLEERSFWTLIYCVFLGGLVGSKLLYILIEWRSFASGELGWLRDLRFGFVFYGGFLGALAAGWVFARRTGADFFRGADYFGVALPLGHAVGRLACLAAGCCYGRPTDLPWAIRFTNPASLVPEDFLGVKLHPTQIYESLANAALAAILLRLLRRVQAGRLREGTVFLGYLFLYAGLRFLIEIFRGDDRGAFWLGLSPSQALAAVVGVLSLLVWGARTLRAVKV